MKYHIILALILMGLLSCKKNTPTPAPVVTPAPVTIPQPNFYFKATIDGQPVDLNDLDIAYGSGAGQSKTSSDQHEQSMVVNNNLSSYPSGGALIVKTFSASVEKCSQVESMFSTQKYPAANLFTGIDGASIYYIDEAGKYWSSSADSNSTQPNWKFEITSHTLLSNDSFAKYLTEASFECTLYDANGNTKSLTNGLLKSRSVQCDGLN